VRARCCTCSGLQLALTDEQPSTGSTAAIAGVADVLVTLRLAGRTGENDPMRRSGGSKYRTAANRLTDACQAILSPAKGSECLSND
jgi:hypothetical protein